MEPILKTARIILGILALLAVDGLGQRESVGNERPTHPERGPDTFEVLSYQDVDYRFLVLPLGEMPPVGFALPDFDDSALFKTGSAALGAGRGGLGDSDCPLRSTVQTEWLPDSQLLVRRFVTLPSGVTGVRVMVSVDNDIVGVFFDGQPLIEYTLGTESVTHDGCPILDEFRFDVPQALVKPGFHMVAFHVQDRGVESFFDASILAESTSPVSGTILAPRAGDVFFDNPTGETIFFEGNLIAPFDTDVRVVIDVMANPAADPNQEASWQRDVATAQLTPFGGETYTWNVAAAVFNTTSWPSGDIGRVGARWMTTNGEQGLLTAVDTQNTPLQIQHTLVTDGDPTPTEVNFPPSYLNALDGRRGFSHFDDPDAQRTETEAYYAGIGSDFSDGGPSVLDALASLDAFRKRYFTPDLTEYITRYYNRGDLGIGREMHCVFGGERACYVSNYGPIDANGNPIFGDREQSLAALQQGQPFATVAMVERGGMARHSPNKVFFVVYNAAGQLEYQAPLDNKPLDEKRQNTFIPGNCMICHGGSGSYDAMTHAVTDAYFLPFDVAAFDFASSDPNDPLSLEAQHDIFRAMNREIYFTTDTGLLPNSVIIKHWYQNDFTNGRFDGDAIPPVSSWNVDASRQQLYRRVFAPACRTCHVSQEGRFSFFDYPDFEASKNLVLGLVCGVHRMPNAEQTLKEFWRGDGRAHLLGHLPGLIGACPPETP